MEVQGCLHGMLIVGDFKKGMMVVTPVDHHHSDYPGLRKAVSAWRAKLIADMINASISMTCHESWTLPKDRMDIIMEYDKNRKKYPNGLQDHPDRVEVFTTMIEMPGKCYMGMAPLKDTEIKGVKTKTFGEVDMMVSQAQNMGGRFFGMLKENRKVSTGLAMAGSNIDEEEFKKQFVEKFKDSVVGDVLHFEDLLNRKNKNGRNN